MSSKVPEKSSRKKVWEVGKPPSETEQRVWREKVKAKNSKHWTPELKEEFERRSRTFQTRSLCARKCKRMHRANKMTRSAWADGMKTASAALSTMRSPVATPEMREACERELTRSCETTLTNLSRLQDMVADDARDSIADSPSLSETVKVSVLAERRMDAMESAMIAAGADLDVDDDEMAKLLNELRMEPVDDVGREAKFKLYEKFQETICDARKALFKFWQDCKKDFAKDSGDSTVSAAVRTVENDLKDIDRARNMGFPDMSGSAWFVYHMAVKVEKNNALLDRILKGIETKIELLAKQDDCPICLENLDDSPAVLGCCHKVCSECWAHWSAMQGSNAFCPLCKHNDFLGCVMCD